MKRYILAAVFALMFSPLTHADDALTPATSTDSQSFDQAIEAQHEAAQAEQHEASDTKKLNKDNFGERVSAEAKQMHDGSSELSGKHGRFGEWVREQRAEDDRAEQSGSEVDSGDHNANEVSGHDRNGDTEHGQRGNDNGRGD